MRKNTVNLLILGVLLMAGPLGAQDEQPAPIVAKSYFVDAKAGHAADFEKAYAGHIKWHADNNDDWTWDTWQVASGKRQGQYIVRTGNHSWADFDAKPEFQQKDGQHYVEYVSPHVNRVSSLMTVLSPEISNWPADYGTPKMVEVSMIRVHDEAGRTFYHAIKKLHEAIVEKEIPFTYSWAWVANGKGGVNWVLAMPFSSWEEYGANMQVPFWKMVEEAFGDYETDMLRKMWSKSVAHSDNFVVSYRDDLSYAPTE